MWNKLLPSFILLSSFVLLWHLLRDQNQELGVLSQQGSGRSLNFNLKHIYTELPRASSSTRLDLDAADDGLVAALEKGTIVRSCRLKAQRSQIQRLKNRSPDMMESYIYHSLENPQINTQDSLEWTIQDAMVPNITDPETILQLAKLASNAYARLPSDPTWRDVGDPDANFGVGFNISDSFGWTENGLRGHVFVEQVDGDSAPLVIIAIKGTTAAALGGGNGGGGDEDGQTGDNGKTVEMDKFNDNLLFSCCCARVSSLWTTVCDCYEKAFTCNQNCLENSLRRPDIYYKAALDIYRNVSNLYPDSEVWVTGHSLGGAISSLLGRTYGLPVVSFEAPGEMLATKRLHLPMPPGIPASMEHVWHFGNNADPIFMGVCNGASSSCNIAGYALETMCHSGMKCVYDTVNELGWHVSILNHRMKSVIDNLLAVSNETARCEKPPPCIDCYDWTFVDHSSNRRRVSHTVSAPTSSTSSSASTTTTSTKARKCLKRTWYGSCYKWSDDGDDVYKGNANRNIHGYRLDSLAMQGRDDVVGAHHVATTSLSAAPTGW